MWSQLIGVGVDVAAAALRFLLLLQLPVLALPFVAGFSAAGNVLVVVAVVVVVDAVVVDAAHVAVVGVVGGHDVLSLWVCC